jgi:uncharacterized membrane protein YeaQ/YmgE (transglycosylase-associated protein family)
MPLLGTVLDRSAGGHYSPLRQRLYRWPTRQHNHLGYVQEDRMLANFIWWIIVGLIAGWAAGKIMKGGGYGVVMDIVLGIIGAMVGGWIFNALGIYPGGGIIGSVVVAIIGAVFLIWLTRLLKKA